MLKIQIHTDGLEMLDGPKKVDPQCPSRSIAQAINHIEATSTCIVEHCVKAWPLISALRSRDVGVALDLHDLPTTALSRMGYCTGLVRARVHR